MYDRIFVITTSFYAYGTHSANVRAFFKIIYGVAPDRKNDWLLISGYVTCLSLPLIGVFDEHNYTPIHYMMAAFFFSAFGFYALNLGEVMYTNIDKFPKEDAKIIWFICKFSYFIVILDVLFGLSFMSDKMGLFIRPVLEWTIVLSAVNFFYILSLTNRFYDSIHPYGELLPPLRER